jgi:hypothetical protein
VTFAFGLAAEYHHPVNPQMSVVGTFAGMYALIDSDLADVIDITVLYFPILGGVKFNFTPQMYGIGQAGLTYSRASSDGESNSETDLSLNFGVGARFGNFDLRGSLWIPTIDEVGDLGLTIWGIYHFGGAGGAAASSGY